MSIDERATDAAPAVPLLPENPRRMGPVTRWLVLRTVLLIALVEVIGSVLVFAVGGVTARALGLGMVFPGAGFLYIGAPLLFISGWFLFFAKPGVSPAYLTVWLAVAYAAFSICVLSQTAWGSLLSQDYDQRSRIYGWWQTANVIGVLLALVLAALPLLMHLSGDAGRSVRLAWHDAQINSDALAFDSPQGRTTCRPVATVLALGGASWQRLGSDGAWAPWLAARSRS